MSDVPSDSMTLLDLIGIVVVVASIVAPFCTVLLVPPAARLFEDPEMTLPMVTRLALMRWPLVVPGLGASVLATAGTLALGAPVGRRRTVLLAGFLLAGGSIALGLCALHLPRFQLSNTIR